MLHGPLDIPQPPRVPQVSGLGAAGSLLRPRRAGAQATARGDAGAERPPAGRHLKAAFGVTVAHFDIHQGATMAVLCHLYNGLVTYNLGDGLKTIVPDLAAKWTVSPDGKRTPSSCARGSSSTTGRRSARQTCSPRSSGSSTRRRGSSARTASSSASSRRSPRPTPRRSRSSSAVCVYFLILVITPALQAQVVLCLVGSLEVRDRVGSAKHSNTPLLLLYQQQQTSPFGMPQAQQASPFAQNNAPTTSMFGNARGRIERDTESCNCHLHRT